MRGHQGVLNHARRYYWKKKRQGLCVVHGCEIKVKKYTYCKKHRDYMAKNKRERLKRFKSKK